MARIGEPEEIVQTFYDLCNDEATPLLQRAAEAYIRDEYSRLPDCVLRFMQSGLLSRKAIMAAHTVLTACCDDDIGDLVGWMKPGNHASVALSGARAACRRRIWSSSRKT
jgi:hypothetical protein